MPLCQKGYVMTTPKIIKVASVEDLREATFHEVVEFTDIHGQLRRVAISRADMNAPRKVEELLLSKGFPRHGIVRAELEKLLESEALFRRKLPPCFGWASNETFISAIGVFGKTDQGGIEWGQPSFQPGNYALPRSKRGDVGSWLADVAWECCLSSVGTVAVSAAFAAAILKAVDEPPFIINLSGSSKSGKSTIAVAAASANGIGHERELPNFNGTVSATTELLTLYNDQLLPMNEVSLVRGGRTKVNEVLRDLTYVVAEGRGRTVNSRSQYSNSAVAGQFKTIVLTTAERSVQQYAEDAGAERDGGEFARIFDLPVRRGPYNSIFDLAPRDEQSEEAVAKRCQRIRESASRYHGVALPVFVDHLISKGPDLPKTVRALQNEFVDSIDQNQLPDAAWRHGCRSFGILFAGGVLARETWLLPHEPEELKGILGAVFRDAAKDWLPPGKLAAVQPLTEKPAKLLEDTLQRLKREGLLVERKPDSRFGTEVAGYWWEPNWRTEFVLHSDALRRELGDDKLRAVLQFLQERGVLIRRNSSKDRKGSFVEQCTRFPVWPHGKAVRSFHFEAIAEGGAQPT